MHFQVPEVVQPSRGSRCCLYGLTATPFRKYSDDEGNNGLHSRPRPIKGPDRVGALFSNLVAEEEGLATVIPLGGVSMNNDRCAALLFI